MVENRKDTLAGMFELERFLPYRLSLLSNTVSQGIAQIYHERYRLSVPEWRVMAVLGRYPGLTASQLGERTVMDKVTVSRAVNSLLKRKYVQRITDSADRRKRPLRVSEGPGRKLLQDVIPLALEYQAALWNSLSSPEQRSFETLLDKLLDKARRLKRKDPT